MAPINTDLMGWAVSETPEAAFLSILIIFILSIALLLICTTCKKHSFQLEEKAPKENSSTLVRVEAKGDGARHNPAVNEITSDEIGNLEISKDALAYKPYRSHTLTPGERSRSSRHSCQHQVYPSPHPPEDEVDESPSLRNKRKKPFL